MYQGTLETISNRADWFGTIELIEAATRHAFPLKPEMTKSPSLTA
jgi:hypothetical protein